MDTDFIISHMNEHHKASLIQLVKKFSFTTDIQDATLVGVDVGGLDIMYNGKETLRIDFPKKITPEQIKDEIITLCKRVGSDSSSDTDKQVEKIQQEIEEFKNSFGSIVLASLDSHNQVISSYAPLIHYDKRLFIYISAVADHYHSIKANPQNIEIMFLEDESKAASVILRKRLRYKVKARFIERESDEFKKAFSVLEDSMGGYGGVKQIKKMLDFHLIELTPISGRFVKGFGQAYNIEQDGSISYIGAAGNPHTLQK